MKKHIGVVGCGQMGLGIVEVAVRARLEVVAVRLSGKPEEARARLGKTLDRAVAKGKLSAEERVAALARVTFTSELAALGACELVIESGVEDLSTKRALLASIEAVLAPTAVLATNTSSLRLATLAEPLQRPELFLGLHFFNPVAAMNLVELAPTERTSSEAIDAARDLVALLGKTPVRVDGTPGYVVNRLLVPYILHAIESLEAGVAGAEEIDAAMKLGCGHPMGPLALADLIGLDVVYAMARTLHTELRDSRYRAPSLLRRLVLAKQLGRKSGLGIYEYTETTRVNPTLLHTMPRPAVRGVRALAAE